MANDNVAIDPSSIVPLQASTNTPPTPPAGNPQGNPVSIDTSSIIPLSSGSDPDAGVGGSIAGPGTALGAKLIEGQNSEVSGISDVMHGNIRQGLGKIYDQEVGNMHVIQGSPIEKIIQRFNPAFKGGIAPTDAEAQNHANRAGLDNPAVDIAASIDKTKNPVWKAVAEASQSLTSPGNVAILISTGGAGLVESPKALGTANKLLSAGFSANAIGQAYAHLKDFKDAYDKGDANEALYQMTHSVLSGALAYMAGSHAGEDVVPGVKSVAASPSGALVTKGADLLDKTGLPGAAAQAVTDVKNSGPAKAVTAATDYFKSTPETAPDLIGKITQGTGDDITAAGRALPTVDTSKVQSFDDLRSTLDNQVRKNTAQVDSILSQDPKLYKAADLEKTTPVPGGTPIVTNPAQEALDQLHDFYQKTKDAKGEASITALQNKFETEGLTVKEVNDLAREHGTELNAYNANGELASGLTKQAAENTRQDVKEQVRQLSPKIADIDSNTSDLITTRGLAEDMADKVQKLENKIQESGILQKLGTVAGKTIDVATGGLVKGLINHFIGEAGDSGKAGTAIDIEDNLRDNLDKLDKLTKMTPQQAVQAMKPPAIPTEGLPDWLSAPGRALPEGFTQKDLNDHELGHVFMGNEAGLKPVDVISNKHPEMANSPNGLARARFDWSDLGIQPNGTIPTENIKSNISGFLKMYMGGAAANEVLGGIEPKDNPGLVGDKRAVVKMLHDLGYTQEEAQAKVDQAYTDAKTHLSKPEISDAIKQASGTRETDLPETHHYSAARVQEILNGVKNGTENGNETGLAANDAQLGKADDTAGKVGNKGGTGQKVADAEANTGLKEKSTGDDKVDSHIKAAGAIPSGSMENLALFHDPQTGSTLALNKSDITSPEVVKQHLEKSRAKFGAQTLSPEEKQKVLGVIAPEHPFARAIRESNRIANIVPELSEKGSLTPENFEAIQKAKQILDKVGNPLTEE